MSDVSLIVSVIEGLDALPEALREKWLEQRDTSFFTTLTWFETLAKFGLPNDRIPRIYLVSRGSSCIAALPCCRSTNDRVLRSLTNFYSNGYSLVRFDKYTDGESEIAIALAEYIVRERPRWSAIDFQFFVDSDPSVRSILSALDKYGLAAYSYFQYDNLYSTTRNLRFNEYYDARPSKLRNTATRKEKALRRNHKLSLAIYKSFVSVDERDSATKMFVDIYNKSWKRPEPYPNFLPELVRSTSERGQLRLGLLTIDGEPAASQLWMVHNRSALIYKLAYAEKFKEKSAGTILSVAMFRNALDEDQVDEIDYGVGSDAYKHDWMEQRRSFVGIVAFNPRTVSGFARLAYHLLGRARFRAVQEAGVRTKQAGSGANL